MKITTVSAPDAASSPAHPDHERWVKETTLKMEVEHAERVGLPLRVAEANNARLLERSARKAAEAKPKPKKRTSYIDRVTSRGVTAKVAKPIKVPKKPPCNWCGVCRNCSREKRVMQIIQMRSKDPFLGDLARKLVEVALRLGPYQALSASDHATAIVREAERACDASVSRLGAWFR